MEIILVPFSSIVHNFATQQKQIFGFSKKFSVCNLKSFHVTSLVLSFSICGLIPRRIYMVLIMLKSIYALRYARCDI
jgi:hypothetical protein